MVNWKGVAMGASVVNFSDLKARKLAQNSERKQIQWRQQTLEFANKLNEISNTHHIDPVHQATLLMAKAIDVLALAGPVPSSVSDQHARAGNLLQSVFRARKDLLEKSVKIISAENLQREIWEKDGLSL